MTDKEYVRGVLLDMLNHYYENIGNKSKYTDTIITPKMIGKLTERFLELGGKLTREEHTVNRKELEKV